MRDPRAPGPQPRRWFVTPELLEWKQQVACGDYAGPFFTFPNNPSGIDSVLYARTVNGIRRYFCDRCSTRY